MKENSGYVSAKPLSIQSSYDVSTFDIHLNGIFVQKPKFGINQSILPSLLNQQLMLLIHQPDGFVYKLICMHNLILYTKN